MLAQRRTRWNFGLQHAVARARALGKPLVVVEALSCSYRWAADRHHAFVIDGMRDQRDAFAAAGVTYLPYVEPEADAGKGLHEALAERAASTSPTTGPASTCRGGPCRCGRDRRAHGAVDSCGILPLNAAGKAFARPRLPPARAPRGGRRSAPSARAPSRAPGSRRSTPAGVGAGALARHGPRRRRPPHAAHRSRRRARRTRRGGQVEARRVMERFVAERLGTYLDRNQPEADASSGLSPWLHYGHVSAHEVFHRVAEHESWDPSLIEGQKATGKREGWWGMSAASEGFMDELVTWREVCLNTCENHPRDYGRYESLPDFARKTLAEHADDPRPHVYTLEQFENAETHDPLWNAAQNQLRREGIIHNYLRMLWGKKILHWSESPQEAHRIMVELNNKYGLDGRDPNSWGGIMWVLGRYDRAWGPEREIFGKVRYMTSDNTARKVRVKNYVARYSGTETGSLF